MTGAGRNKAFISKSADNDIVAVCLSCAGAACREAHCLVITCLTHCPKMEINYRKQSLNSTFSNFGDMAIRVVEFSNSFHKQKC